MANAAADRSGLVRAIGVLIIIFGVIYVVAGGATWALVASNLRNEQITVSSDAAHFAGGLVDTPWEAWAQADAIEHHALKASGGKTYAQLPQDDPTRTTVMNASFLRASLYTSVVAFGVAVLVFGTGVLLILIGWALHRSGSIFRRTAGAELAPAGVAPAAVAPAAPVAAPAAYESSAAPVRPAEPVRPVEPPVAAAPAAAPVAAAPAEPAAPAAPAAPEGERAAGAHAAAGAPASTSAPDPVQSTAPQAPPAPDEPVSGPTATGDEERPIPPRPASPGGEHL